MTQQQATQHGRSHPSGQRMAALDGRTRIDRFRRAMDSRGPQYAEDFFVYGVSTGALAPGATSIQLINIQQDSAFEWVATTGGAQPTGADPLDTLEGIDITIVDSASSRNLMNAAVPMANIVGNGQTPFILPISRRFMPRTQIMVVLHNYTAGTTFSKVNFSMIGRKIFMDTLPGTRGEPLPRFSTFTDEITRKLYCEDLYMYDFRNASLAATVAAATTVLIENDSDFEWIASTFSAIGGGAVKPATQVFFSAQIKDGGSQRNLFNQAINVQDFTGDGLFPFILPQPRIFLAKTPIELTLTNISAATTYTEIHLTMIGRKIFELNE